MLRINTDPAVDIHDPDQADLYEALFGDHAFPGGNTYCDVSIICFPEGFLDLPEFDPNVFTSSMSICLGVPDMAMITYEDSIIEDEVRLIGDMNQPGVFAIDDGGGDDEEIERRFLISRSEAMNRALEFTATKRIEVWKDDAGDWKSRWTSETY